MSRRRLRVLGLTGSIGMGKSTASAMLRRLGVAVFSADDFVHELLAPGGAAVAAVARAFPAAKKGKAISRPALGRAVFGDDAALRRLEAILHPLVRAGERDFIRHQTRLGNRICALEIPLLFETGAEVLCDAVVVVIAPVGVQESRVLARSGMTRARLAAVRARQMSETEKISRADFCIATGLGRRHTLNELKRAVAAVLRRRPRRRGVGKHA